jgi:energy-coupling factor transport system substrate-specific component
MTEFLQSLAGFFTSMATVPGIISIVLVVLVIIAIRIWGKDLFKLSTRSVVAIGIGAALYAAVSFIAIPIGPNTSFRIAIAILSIFGALFGPIVGFLVGFIGHALNDALAWGSVWWSWVFLSAVIGLFAGMVNIDKKFNPLKGALEVKNIIQMYIFSFVGIIAASVVAYLGDVFLYGEPADKVWIQIIIASISNYAVIAVVGIPAVILIGRMYKSRKNLTEEE